MARPALNHTLRSNCGWTDRCSCDSSYRSRAPTTPSAKVATPTHSRRPKSYKQRWTARTTPAPSDVESNIKDGRSRSIVVTLRLVSKWVIAVSTLAATSDRDLAHLARPDGARKGGRENDGLVVSVVAPSVRTERCWRLNGDKCVHGRAAVSLVRNAPRPFMHEMCTVRYVVEEGSTRGMRRNVFIDRRLGAGSKVGEFCFRERRGDHPMLHLLAEEGESTNAAFLFLMRFRDRCQGSPNIVNVVVVVHIVISSEDRGDQGCAAVVL